MKHRYIFEKHIDPFDEEDWDEKENDITTFKIRITNRTKQISISSFPVIISKSGDHVVVYDDRHHRIYVNNAERFENDVNHGLTIDNYYIIKNDKITEEDIVSTVKKYLSKRKRSALRNIDHYKSMIYDYDNGDYDDDDDIDTIEDNMELEELLVDRITEFIHNGMVERFVKKMLVEIL